VHVLPHRRLGMFGKARRWPLPSHRKKPRISQLERRLGHTSLPTFFSTSMLAGRGRVRLLRNLRVLPEAPMIGSHRRHDGSCFGPGCHDAMMDPEFCTHMLEPADTFSSSYSLYCSHYSLYYRHLYSSQSLYSGLNELFSWKNTSIYYFMLSREGLRPELFICSTKLIH
jgi:hypothetical protein